MTGIFGISDNSPYVRIEGYTIYEKIPTLLCNGHSRLIRLEWTN